MRMKRGESESVALLRSTARVKHATRGRAEGIHVLDPLLGGHFCMHGCCLSGMGVGSPGRESDPAVAWRSKHVTPHTSPHMFFSVQCRVDNETFSGLQFNPPIQCPILPIPHTPIGLATSSVFLPPTQDSLSIPCMHLWSVGVPCFCLSLSLSLSLFLSLPPLSLSRVETTCQTARPRGNMGSADH